ncbi:MAG: type II CRISPR-associated endonuclease Cas1 [Kiritimatiellae bacterium]|nr:type II CRISPR-associated endonuclease Cas1 [Kiritimatiellia bacterium]
MAHHILHILTHGVSLGRDRGHLICRAPKQDDAASDRRMPLEDLRAVVIAARGVTLTSSAMAGILENEGIILHCGERYQPIGVTAPLPRTVDPKTMENQARRLASLNQRVWNRLLRGKTRNQRGVLADRKISSAYLDRALTAPKIDESNCARQYWRLYFPSIGWSGSRRDRHCENPPNQMLNYGYAVLGALCHRSLIIHGLLPQIGVGHCPSYRGDPLVYDVMEPYRPFVDWMLAYFMAQRDTSMESWCRLVGRSLKELRTRRGPLAIKLMDAIDHTARSLGDCYRQLSADPLWVPDLGVDMAT